MKKNILLLACLFALMSNLIAAKPGANAPKFKHGFVANRGQIMDQYAQANASVLYLFEQGNLSVQLKEQGFSYEINAIEKNNSLKLHRVDIRFVNASTGMRRSASGQIAGDLIFYSKQDANKYVKTQQYERVYYANVYEGIDVEFLLTNQEGKSAFKYNFIVHPGADANQIRMEISGADKLQLSKSGSILMKTSLGKLEEKLPLSFERNANLEQGKEIKASFKRLGKNLFGIQTEAYNTKQTLVIDPIVWSTYFGGSTVEDPGDIALDASGNIFMSGRTTSTSGLASNGAYQGGLAGGYDGFLAKFSPSGTLLWATYYGGTSNDELQGLFVDGNGNVLVTGTTSSTSGIVTSGAYQGTIAGSNDGILAYFSKDGALLRSTYMGGTGTEAFMDITMAADGGIYTVGSSTSSTMKFTYPGIHQDSIKGLTDVIIIRWLMNATNFDIKWATYYGGSLNDNAYAVCLDGAGYLYVSGNTFSSTGMETPGAYQEVNSGGGLSDGYVGKFSTVNGSMVHGTFYGGTASDVFAGMTIDVFGGLYFVGYTSSASKIHTTGAYDTVYSGAGYDACIIKMDTTLHPVWGTYYGGTGADYNYQVITDALGNVYTIGLTGSSTDISTAGAPQPVFGGLNDAFMTIFTGTGSLFLGTYFGGTANDEGHTVLIDNSNNLYFFGRTISDGLATPGAWQTTRGGNNDMFLTKYFLGSSGPISNNTIPSSTGFCTGGGPLTINGSTPSGGNGTFTFVWQYSATGPSGPWSLATGVSNTEDYIVGIPSANAYYRRLVYSDIYGDTSAACTVFVGSALSAVIGVNKTIQCLNTNKFIFSNLTVGAGFNTDWDFGNGVLSTNAIDSVTYLPGVDNMYTVRMIVSLGGGCADTAYKNVYVISSPPVKTISGNTAVYIGSTQNYSVTNASGSTFKWMFGSGTGSSYTNSINIKWTAIDTVELQMVETNGGGCVSDTSRLQVIIKDPTGTEEWFANELNIYPNPSSGFIHIENAGNTNLQANLFDLQGMLVQSEEMGSNRNLDLSKHKDGIYLLRLTDAEGNFVQKRIEVMHE